MRKFVSLFVMILSCTCVSVFADEATEVTISTEESSSAGDVVSQNSEEADAEVVKN